MNIERTGRGYTFIELICVVIVIAVLASAAIPIFKRTFQGLELSSTVQEMYSFMNYLRERALSEQTIIHLYIGADKEEYWAQAEGAAKRIKTFHVPAGITLDTEKEIINFYPDGRIDKVELKFTALPEKEVILTTRGVFGGVKIMSGE